MDTQTQATPTCTHQNEAGLWYNDAHGDGTCNHCCYCEDCQHDREFDAWCSAFEARWEAARQAGKVAHCNHVLCPICGVAEDTSIDVVRLGMKVPS